MRLMSLKLIFGVFEQTPPSQSRPNWWIQRASNPTRPSPLFMRRLKRFFISLKFTSVFSFPFLSFFSVQFHQFSRVNAAGILPYVIHIIQLDHLFPAAFDFTGHKIGHEDTSAIGPTSTSKRDWVELCINSQLVIRVIFCFLPLVGKGRAARRQWRRRTAFMNEDVGRWCDRIACRFSVWCKGKQRERT